MFIKAMNGDAFAVAAIVFYIQQLTGSIEIFPIARLMTIAVKAGAIRSIIKAFFPNVCFEPVHIVTGILHAAIFEIVHKVAMVKAIGKR